MHFTEQLAMTKGENIGDISEGCSFFEHQRLLGEEGRGAVRWVIYSISQPFLVFAAFSQLLASGEFNSGV